jgi:hypothetical protein
VSEVPLIGVLLYVGLALLTIWTVREEIDRSTSGLQFAAALGLMWWAFWLALAAWIFFDAHVEGEEESRP